MTSKERIVTVLRQYAQAHNDLDLHILAIVRLFELELSQQRIEWEKEQIDIEALLVIKKEQWERGLQEKIKKFIVYDIGDAPVLVERLSVLTLLESKPPKS
ncbi:MAG TPA: hypothetical protein VF974_07445 [Patescibacteria group bacterium]